MILRQVKDAIKYRLNKPLRRRQRLLKHFGITKILDVGANKGQYAQELRKIKFEGQIVSFEPIQSVFEILEKNRKNDKNSILNNYALGDKNEIKTINIAKNLASSSFFLRTKYFEEIATQTEYISTESVEIKVLDDIYDTICSKDDIVFLKLDTQGYEKNILAGSALSLNKIKGVQIEMALEPTYKDAPNFKEIFNILENAGFKLFSIEDGFEDEKSGQLLELDAIFFRA